MSESFFKQEYYARVGPISEIFIGTIHLKGGKYFKGGKFELERNPAYYQNRESLFSFLKGDKIVNLRDRMGRNVEPSQLIRIIELNSSSFLQ